MDLNRTLLLLLDPQLFKFGRAGPGRVRELRVLDEQTIESEPCFVPTRALSESSGI